MRLGFVDHSQCAKLRDVETTLRALPGVREVAVVVWEDEKPGKERLTGYVVLDDDHVDQISRGAENERRRLQKWRKTYDLTQFGKEAKSSQPGFDIAGWNSSYTRNPIPAEEMREWVDITVSEITSFHPAQILELGCGTGLLLLRIAPRSPCHPIPSNSSMSAWTSGSWIRPVRFAHASTSTQSQAAWPDTVQRGSGISLRCRQA